MISQELVNYIKNEFPKGKIVCLTGAGISAESGIDTFRGKAGLWEKYDPQIYAQTEGLVSLFRKEPKKIVNFILDFYSGILQARPNPGHLALAILEKQGLLEAVITQNIDNLHQQAGSRSVIELHGNAFRIRCQNCARKITLEKDRLKEMLELLKINKDSRIKLLRVISRYFPRCVCGGRYRIDIVLFGELLPEEELNRAYKYLEKCNILLIIGTSLVVYPAAGLPLYAKERGVKLIEINSSPSALTNLCDYKIFGQAGKILPEILKILG